MKSFVRITLIAGLMVALGLPLTIDVQAHEGREVSGGQYEVVIGFLDEPAIQGEKNAMIVEIVKPGVTEGDEATPVEGLAATLQAEVFYSDQKMALEILPLFGEPGSYIGYFFPMAEGDYSFRLFGEIGGNPLDETFTSGPETFSQVVPREPLEFPKLSASTAKVNFPLVVAIAGIAGLLVLVRRERASR